MYKYLYEVTNVPYLQFAGGIFLGSMKPYLLDSYIGVFVKQIVDGNVSMLEGGLEDALLLIALGRSILIGVFANKTWDSINQEIKIEKAEKRREAAMVGKGDDEGEEENVVVCEVMGVGLPQWMIRFQLLLLAVSIRDLAGVWNYTMEEVELPLNDIVDLTSQPGSPKIVHTGTVCNGLVLSTALFGSYLRYADPMYINEGSQAVPMEVGEANGGKLGKLVFGCIEELLLRLVLPPQYIARKQLCWDQQDGINVIIPWP
jgi:hypothetical protein